MELRDAILITGATLRLTRLVTTDDLGLWWVRIPAYRAALHVDIRTGRPPWWDRYRAGLECPHCLGFWAGTFVLATYAAAGKTRPWRFAASALLLSYAVGHVSARLDSTAAPDPAPSVGPAANEQEQPHPE